MKKLLLAALILKACTLSHAMDIIEIPAVDHRSLDVHTVVLAELVKSLSATNRTHRQALARIQKILDTTYTSIEQSQPQLVASHKQVTKFASKL